MRKARVRRVKKPPDKKKTDPSERISFLAAIVSLTASIIALITALLKQ